MRTALAVLAATLAALIGRSLGAVPARRARVLREAMDALQILRVRMLERLLPLHTALAQSRFEAFRRTGERMAAGEDANGAWRALLPALARRGGPLDCLSREDLAALTALFDGLGMGARAEQEGLLSGTARELGRLEAEAAKYGAEKARLYATLGLLFGLMLAVAFI